MPFKREQTRFSHSAGHTHVTFSEDGEKIITSGADGDIRLWEGIADDDPISSCLGEFVLCCEQYSERLLVSTDLNTLQAYTFPDLDKDGTEFKFTASINCIRVNKKYIAAGSDDTEIKYVVLDKSDEEVHLKGHTGPVLQLDLSVNDKIASVSGDGTLKIWDLLEKKEIHSISGFDKCNSFEIAKILGCPSFEPVSGDFLAYPKGKEIIVIDGEKWETKYTLKDNNVTGNYSLCRYSPCGRYLAATSINGEISLWDVKEERLIKGDTFGPTKSSITSICWNPNGTGELVFCDNTGELGIIIDCCEKTVKISNNMIVDDEASEDMNFEDCDIYNKDGDDDDDDNENCVSLEKLKNETLRANGLMDDEESKSIDRGDSRMSDYRSLAKVDHSQKAFQSSATPHHLEHRYMLWNHIGIVRSHKTDSENAIEVEFHDASTHHGIHMNNYLNHTMASLSSTVLALSGETPSKLVCIALGASGSKEWSSELPNCEEVLAVGASDKLVAIATDAKNLRIFSVMGTLREVISIPGPVISVTGFDDKLMVVYHSSPANDEQQISALLLQAFGLTMRCREVKVPLSPKAKLSWIGYSDKGSPVTYDTMSVLRMYNFKSNLWYPICDLRLHTKGASDTFFIVDVSEDLQTVRAVLCRGSSFPVTSPRPMINELPMQLPFCDMDTEKSQLEETLFRAANFSMANADKVLKEAALKLFAAACRSEAEARARELIEMIALPSLLPLAIKYASKLGRMHLAEKLSELQPYLEEQEKEREKQIQDSEIELFQSSPMSMSLLLASQRDRNATPEIIPKPMSITQKRNPFKRSATKSGNSGKHALSHLTGKVIGFHVDENLSGSESTESHKESEDIENVDINTNSEVNTPPPVGNYMSWFKANKEDLMKQHPEVAPAELTKFGMRIYKSLTAPGSSTTPISSGKRKLNDSGSAEKTPVVSKLAKFGFGK